VSWAGSKAVDLYLGTRAVVLCRGAELMSKSAVVGLEAALRTADAQLQQNGRRSRLRVWLSGGLCRPFLMPDIPGVGSSLDLQKVAATMAPARTGLDGDCKVWLDGQKSSAGTLAVALQGTVLAQILAGLAPRGRVVSIRPWWAEVLRARLALPAKPGAVGVRDCDSLTVLAGRNDGFDVASVVTPLFDQASSESAWTRALFSADLQSQAAWQARLVIEDRNLQPFAGCALGPLVEVAA